jgi:hypothetical protein
LVIIMPSTVWRSTAAGAAVVVSGVTGVVTNLVTNRPTVALLAALGLLLLAGVALQIIVTLTSRDGTGQRHIACGSATVNEAGRDAVITGNLFIGGFARLRDVWLDPTSVFEATMIDRFVGRSWLVDSVEQYFNTYDRGYVVIRAAAGMGKTTFAAWLARNRGWPCHFTHTRNGRSTRIALPNLAGQLIAGYQLTDWFVRGDTLPETAGEPGWFEQVLRAAAEAAQSIGKRLVLVVDGLDEAEYVEGDLPLGLPATLPRGAYIVLTCRTGTWLTQLRRPYEIIEINATDRYNTDDIAAYLSQAAVEPALAELLAAEAMDVDEFVARMIERCGGLWVYTRYVLDELRERLRSVRDLDRLPADLANYYAECLLPGSTTGAALTDATWGHVRLPLLATLAAAAEPLTAEVWARFAGLTEETLLTDLNDRQVRPFLTISADHTGERRYGLFHFSVRDFLSGRSTPTDRDDGACAEELAHAVQAAHCRIREYYLNQWGGLDKGLPLLAADLTLAQKDDRYPLRALAEHLVAGGRVADLHQLLACDVNGRNVWYTAHDAAGHARGFLDDVATAQRTLEH